MKYICVLVIACALVFFSQGFVTADETEDLDKKINILQTQIDILKDQIKTQAENKEQGVVIKIEDEEEESDLEDFEHLGVNTAFEINLRYRQNVKDEGSSPGFQMYEFGLMVDSEINEWTSGYIEYNFLHSNTAEMEDGWIDIHLPNKKKAFAGGTGLKLGHFHPPFGWDNDDCEGWLYGGRTSINSALMRNQRIDGQYLRERQIGIQGNYSFDLKEEVDFTLSAGVFNGNGDSLNYGGRDNDTRRDFVARAEGRFDNIVVGTSYWYAPSTKGATSNANNTTHVRNLHRYGVHFKYPANAGFPGNDYSLGGENFLIWGEAMYGIAEGNSLINNTQKFWGGYLEGDFPITSWSMGFLRFGYWEPDRDNKGDADIFGITPGIYLTLWPGVSLWTLEYEYYQGGSQEDNDRFATEIQIFF